MKSDYPFPDKCEKCIHDDVCYMVGECLNHLPDFECDCFEEKRPNGEWKRISIDKYIRHASCFYRCSVCGEDTIGETNFCPNCGSDNRKRGEAE